MKKTLLTALVCLTFSCGAPKFAVKYEYIPPNNNEACLKKCRISYTECQKKCIEEEKECKKNIRTEAERLYRESLLTYRKELESYTKALSSYRAELLDWNNEFRKIYDDYSFFRNACRKEKDKYACRREKELKEELENLEREKPTPPARPKRPSLTEILEKLERSCRRSCNCGEEFDRCFISCGGKLRPVRFCIENCEKR
ncbi:MAG: hypothetical protein ABGX12_05365 [Desulfurobacteriaceae bacterium]